MTIYEYIKNNPKKTGWVRLDNDDKFDWFYIRNNQKLYKNCVVTISGEKYAFGENGNLIDGLLFLEVQRNRQIPEYKINFYLDLNDVDILSFDKYFNPYITDVMYVECNENKSLFRTGTIKLKLADNHLHTFLLTEDDGTQTKNRVINDVLNINGLVVDKYMLEGPSKKYGLVHAYNSIYLCDKNGRVLNNKKNKYVDGKHIYYVNSDNTFFYSTNLEDPKWY